ncbi:uncharacterized protein LOC143174855 [Nomia melanderi]|uniref:uncharacterized protein LOC143174855 n=1 Tax=Nomia melanderi TaxID=2448451 RepID=UPI003FCEB5DA
MSYFTVWIALVILAGSVYSQSSVPQISPGFFPQSWKNQLCNNYCNSPRGFLALWQLLCNLCCPNMSTTTSAPQFTSPTPQSTSSTAQPTPMAG